MHLWQRFWSDDRNIWLALLSLLVVVLIVLIAVTGRDVSPRGVLGPRWPPATPTASGGVDITSGRGGATLHAFSIADAAPSDLELSICRTAFNVPRDGVRVERRDRDDGTRVIRLRWSAYEQAKL